MSDAANVARDPDVVSDYDLVPRMVTTWEEVKDRLDKLQKFVSEVMREGIHYGPPYPGSDKKMLYKAGAELLAEIYAYTVVPKIVHRIERWTPADGGPFFQYEFEADVISKRTGMVVGKGFGSCNSMENRYRWRQAARTCPACNAEALIKSRFGKAGWYCFPKKGGCGENFDLDDKAITEQEIGRVENDDVHTLVNTVLQVAKKRCFVAAVITVTQSSMLFESGEDADDGDDAPSGDTKRRASGSGNGHARGGTKSQGTKANGSGDKPPDEKHPHKVVVRGETHWTAGIDFKSLLRVWDLQRGYDKRFGADSAKAFMKKLLGVESSHDLNEEMAERLITALQGELDAAGDPPPAEDGPADPYAGAKA